MTPPPRRTDRHILNLHRARATALFLQDAAADDVQERLIEVNRTFTTPAIVTGFPDFWKTRMPKAKVVDDADVLDLEENAHDLVIHGLSLHWADDPIGQLVQCRRALKPDGLLIATLFAGQTLHELRSAIAEAEAAILGGLSPRVLPMGEIRDLGGLLQRAGFALPVADIMPLNVTYESPIHLMKDLRAMGESNAMLARTRTLTTKALFTHTSAIYQNAFSVEGDRVQATFEIATLTGWAPAESQPKPLKPGSATNRLADVLGTQETPLDPSKD